MKQGALFPILPRTRKVHAWLRSIGPTCLLSGLLVLSLVSCQKQASPQPASQSASQPASQTASQPGSQPGSQPASQAGQTELNQESSAKSSSTEPGNEDPIFGVTEGLQAREFPTAGTNLLVVQEGKEIEHELLPYDFEDWVLLQTKPVLIDFWSPSCGPCQAIAPVIDDLAVDFQDKVFVIKSQVEKDSDLAQAYHVQAIPTFLTFYQGKIIDTTVGAGPETADHLQKKLQDLLDQGSQK